MAVFVVNPGGAVHSADEAHAANVLAMHGWREASIEEVAAWHAQQGLEAPQAPKAPRAAK